MMPIKIEPRENPKILEMNEKELLEGYYEAEMFHFMPEYLEKFFEQNFKDKSCSDTS